MRLFWIPADGQPRDRLWRVVAASSVAVLTLSACAMSFGLGVLVTAWDITVLFVVADVVWSVSFVAGWCLYAWQRRLDAAQWRATLDEIMRERPR